jgi:protein-disulfide isomerase
MSSDQSPNVPDQGDRREAVREKAQQVRAKQSRARRIRRVSITSAVVAVVGVVAVAVTWTVTSAASKPELAPAHVTQGGFEVTAVKGMVGSDAASVPASTPSPSTGTTAGKKTTPKPSPTPSGSATPQAGSVDIRVYVDYLAPGAAQFQSANAAQLTKWVTQKAATLTYYPVAMLTPKSNGTKYSLRAASAAACVATYSSDTFFAYNNALLTRQPDQGSDGLTDQQLADLAIASGAESTKTVRSCIQDEDYSSWVKASTDKALAGLPGTKDVALTSAPMILVNGQPYVGALSDPKEFAQFVLTIASDSYYSTASPSPTPSPTATAKN